MKHTKEQVLVIAKKILKDFRQERYKESDIENAFFDEKEMLSRGKNKGKLHPCWTISILAPFDNTDFLVISDKTGEPLYYQNFNMIVYEIEKDKEGNYFKEGLPRE